MNPSARMDITPTDIPAVVVITPRRFSDPRGYFCETYNARALGDAGIGAAFVQDNQSMSLHAGVVRGLHFQAPPFAQAKLVRVLRGAILDVTVDIRRDSPTFGRHVAVELSADNGRQLLVPEGFAHGFCTLEPNTEVFYKVTHPYSAAHDKGVIWNDPALAIRWPVHNGDAILSDKDQHLPRLADLPAYF